MKNVSVYKSFTVENFVDDKDFRQWVTNPDYELDLFWTYFLTNYPYKKETVSAARKIVEALDISEPVYDSEDYEYSLNGLKAIMKKVRSKRNKLRQLATWTTRVAAILLVPFIVIGIYHVANNNEKIVPKTVEYFVPSGQKSMVVLADGTKIWLNSESTLYYYLDESSKIRKVKLSGEAHFEVTKDKNHPFLVETKDYEVKVYGTEFNVRSYPEMEESETILKEGKIAIKIGNRSEIEVAPGERFTLNENMRYNISKVNPDLYLGWKDNVLKINNERLSDFIVRLERWYGVKIHVENFENVKNLRYTLTIKTESLREMLALMDHVTPMSYKIDGEQVFLEFN